MFGLVALLYKPFCQRSLVGHKIDRSPHGIRKHALGHPVEILLDFSHLESPGSRVEFEQHQLGKFLVDAQEPGEL